MHRGIAAAVGPTGTSLIAQKSILAGSLEEASGSRIYAGSSTRLVQGPSAVCLILGSPRLAPGLEADRQQNEIDAWRSALFGPTAQLDDRISGHFALAYVDLTDRNVMLMTDRFESYPLYYRVFADGIAFSDCADVLFDVRPSISLQALFNYLYFHCIPSPDTVHEGLKRLQAGRIARWQQGRLSDEAYWNRRAKLPVYTSFKEARRDFRSILREAVSEQTRPGMTGAFLSGGTDSSTIVGVLAEQSETPIKSYSIGFDVEGYDEAAYAELAAKRYGSDHKVYYVTPDDLVSQIPRIAANLDQPFGNSSLLPALVCLERAREDGIAKLLAGDGGDELFGGNARYAKQKAFGWYETIPESLRAALLEPILRPDFISRTPLIRKVRSYVEQAKIPLPDRLETYNLLEREGATAVLSEAWHGNVDAGHPRILQRQTWEELSADNLTDQMLEFDWKFTLADNDLRKVRYASGIAGVEVGFPLLSDQLVDFSLRLKPSWKVKGLKLRWFFKRALEDFLPPEIIRKKKHGFGLPFGSWVLGHEPLRRIAIDAVDGLVDRGLLKRSYVTDLIKHRLPAYPSYYGELVWILMMLELWMRSHSPDQSFDS